MTGPAAHTAKRAASADPPSTATRGLATDTGGGGAAPPSADRLLDGITPVPLPPPLRAWVDGLPGDLRYVLDAITSAGGSAWPVGGCVRDVLTGRAPREVDVCTSLTPEELLAIFPDAVPHRGTGGAFLTTSITRGSVVLEVTTIRTEGAYVDGRRPEAVATADRLLDDLARRDFTINAAAVDVGRGLLLDPFGGAADAAAGILRCVGDPATRLVDDGLRVWRAYRFLDAGATGLRSPDPALAAALASPPVQAAAARVSRERIWEELAKILVGQHAAEVVAAMAGHGALATALGDPAVDTSPSAPGVLAQAHVLPAWRRLHARARAAGLNVHSGEPAAEAAKEAAGTAPSSSSPPLSRPGSPCEDAPFLHAPPPPPRFVLALDLEATCDAPKSPQPQEVIEVGAVLLEVSPVEKEGKRQPDASDDDLEGPPLRLTPVAEFHSHARPTLHPTLSDFCVTFTGVTQADVDAAPGLPDVLASLTAWLVQRGALASPADPGGPGRFVAVTVGDWDLETLVPRQLEAMGGGGSGAGPGRGDAGNDDAPRPALTPPPWATAWCDAGVLYREHYLRPRAGLAQMLGDLGLPLMGRPHAALADAQGLATLLTRLAADGAAPLITRSAGGSVAAYVGDAPDLAVARIALLLSGAGPVAAGRAAKALKLGRHEAKRVMKAVATVGRLPDGSDAAAMRLFRAAMGSQLVLQLLLEASLSAGDTSARLDAFVEEWRRLPPLKAGAAPLLDGAALMAATGLKPGKELGRLKEWLWRIQVERDLGSVEEVVGVLERLAWRGTNPEEWPGMDF